MLWKNSNFMAEKMSFRICCSLVLILSGLTVLAEGQDRGGGHLILSMFKDRIKAVSEMVTRPSSQAFAHHLKFDPQTFRNAAYIANPQCAQGDRRKAIIDAGKLAMVFAKEPSIIWLVCDADANQFGLVTRAQGWDMNSWEELFKTNSLGFDIWVTHEVLRTIKIEDDDDQSKSSSLVTFRDKYSQYLGRQVAAMFLQSAPTSGCRITPFVRPFTAIIKGKLGEIIGSECNYATGFEIKFRAKEKDALFQSETKVEVKQDSDVTASIFQGRFAKLQGDLLKMDLSDSVTISVVKILENLGCLSSLDEKSL